MPPFRLSFCSCFHLSVASSSLPPCRQPPRLSQQICACPFSLNTCMLAAGVVCKSKPDLCKDVLKALFGSMQKVPSSRMGVYTAHWPDRTSIRNMIHWIQVRLTYLCTLVIVLAALVS